MGQHPFVRFGLEHENDRRITGGRVLKGELVAKRRLAGARPSRDEIGITGEQPPVEQPIEPVDSSAKMRMLRMSTDIDNSVRHAGVSWK